uniref:Uncharacterized protein n=1 Tax=Anguilla anguilla TaxID=7936 RepID=A0A0E9RN92_ANGAN
MQRHNIYFRSELHYLVLTTGESNHSLKSSKDFQWG